MTLILLMISKKLALEAEDNYYKMLLEDCAKDYMYFDSTLQSVNEMNEEVASQSGEGENQTKLSQTMTPILAILKKRCQTIRMMMDMVGIMNMVNVIEVITVVMEDMKEKPPQ